MAIKRLKAHFNAALTGVALLVATTCAHGTGLSDTELEARIKVLRQTLIAIDDDPPPALGPGQAKTPSHLYQQTENIIAEIRLLRQSLGIADAPRDPGVQVKKRPLHVYAKSLEIVEKIARAQKRLGLDPVAVPQIPLQKITSGDVFDVTQLVLQQVRRIKAKEGINQTIAPAPLTENKTPSDVYENMWRASYLMDGLAGPTDPNLVYRNTQYILSELALIAPKLGVFLNGSAPAPLAGKTPVDVNIEGFKNLHKTSILQRKLALTPLRVPTFPGGKITPADVFDTTNMLLAELVRLKVHFGIGQARAYMAPPQGKKPADVLAQMQQIGTSLDAMLAKF